MASVTVVEAAVIGLEVTTQTIVVNLPNSVVVTNIGGTDFEPFIFTQSSPAAVWTINHNLGRAVAVDVYGPGGLGVIVDIQHISDNQTVITAGSAFTGVAVIT